MSWTQALVLGAIVGLFVYLMLEEDRRNGRA